MVPQPTAAATHLTFSAVVHAFTTKITAKRQQKLLIF